MAETEVENMLRMYLQRFHSKHYKGEEKQETFLEKELPILREQFWRCVLINHVIWLFAGTLLTDKPD